MPRSRPLTHTPFRKDTWPTLCSWTQRSLKSVSIWLTVFVLSYPGTQLSGGQVRGWRAGAGPDRSPPRRVLGALSCGAKGLFCLPAPGDRDAAVTRCGAARGPHPRTGAPTDTTWAAGNPTGGGVRNTHRKQAAMLSFPRGRSGPRAFHALSTTSPAAFAVVTILILVKQTVGAVGRSEAACRDLDPGQH